MDSKIVINLFKLVREVRKKVDILDEKVDKVFELLYDRKEAEGFSFDPISNETELELVTDLIKNDEVYLRKLRNFLELKGGKDFCSLRDLFEDKFLANSFNARGGYGRKSFTDLYIYKEVYVYLLKKNGVPEKQVTKNLAGQLKKLKNKLCKRKNYHSKKETRSSSMQSEEYEDSESQVSLVESETNLEEHKKDLSIQIKKIDEILDDYIESNEIQFKYEANELDKDEYGDDDVKEDQDHFSIEEEPQNHVEEQEDDIIVSDLSKYYSTFPNEFTFKPINSDRDLKYVTKLINFNQAYLQFLRSHMETAAGDNYCMLKYLFTYEFINQYNYSGTVGKRKLSDLDIITKVYLFLRFKSGLTFKEITTKAISELRKMKNTYNHKRSFHKQKLKGLKDDTNSMEEEIKLTVLKKNQSTKSSDKAKQKLKNDFNEVQTAEKEDYFANKNDEEQILIHDKREKDFNLINFQQKPGTRVFMKNGKAVKAVRSGRIIKSTTKVMASKMKSKSVLR